MTVREVLGVLDDATELRISYGESCAPINLKDRITAEAFGDYVVDRVHATDKGSFEIEIAIRPIKKGEDGR